MRRLIQLIPYQRSAQQLWDALVDRSRNATFLHYRSYMEYHSDRYADASLLFIRDNQLVAALPGALDQGVLSSHAGLTYGGLLMDSSLHSWEVSEIFELISNWGHSKNLQSLVYRCVPHLYHRIPAEDDLYAIHRLGGRLVRRDLSTCIRLDGIRLQMSKGRRSCIARAKRLGLKIVESRDFDGFMRVATSEVESRFGAKPTHNGAELAALASRFPDNIKLLAGYSEGQLLGGVILYLTHTVCRTQYIASTDEGRQRGVVDLCINEALLRFTSGKRWFDFGISTTDRGREVNHGLLSNKESWGGRAVTFDHYVLDFS